MDDESTWWSDDDTDISNTGTQVSSYKQFQDSNHEKSLSLPTKNLGLPHLQSATNDTVAISPSNDVNSNNQLSSSVKSCDDASAFESFSCTDEDDDDCDESDQDSTSIESSSINNR